MITRFLLLMLIFLSIQCTAQTFKVTDVQTFHDRDYQKYAKQYMSKEIEVIFNDNSITITPTNKSSQLNLKKSTTTDNVYYYSTKVSGYYMDYQVIFKKTFGLISSLEFTMTERPTTSLNYTNRVKLTGKRF